LPSPEVIWIGLITGATASVIALAGIGIRLWVGRRLRQATTLAAIAEGHQRITEDALAAHERTRQHNKHLEEENRLMRRRIRQIRGDQFPF